jgi:glycosyltransferase involved in cell wall biosynthesis
MIYLYSDIITRAGGIETYLHALATKLHDEGIPFRVAVSEQEHCPMLDDLEAEGIDIYRQSQVPGDRWHIRKRLLMAWLWWQLEPGDWVYCMRQPIPELYLPLVRTVHHRGAKIAASWRLAPGLMSSPEGERVEPYKKAVEETDAVISVSKCTVDQFRKRYDYEGPVHVVRYHNLPFFDQPVPMPEGPPWKIGYMGRLDIEQKNLDTLLRAFQDVSREEPAELHLHGDGPRRDDLEALAHTLGISEQVRFHGRYDHRTDLPDIISTSHFFVYTSRFEGGPCFTLLELMQAGRYVVASDVGGIPDLYDGHSDAGLLIRDQEEPSEIAAALREGLRRVKEGEVESEEIRKRYDNEFDMEAAHADWNSVLMNN